MEHNTDWIMSQDIITNEQFDQLDEGAKRAFKRKGSSLSHYFRCTTGPKAGKLASDPSKCGQRPDPKKVRHGRKVAKLKGSVRVRKTQMKKKTELSKRISRLNKQLQGHNNRPKRESFVAYHGLATLVEHILLTVEFAYNDDDIYNEVSTQLLDGKYDQIILDQYAEMEHDKCSGFDQAEPLAEMIIESLMDE
ncbi:MAG: hypothetical protein JXR12_01280 [Neptunomonas phycophila]|uniref:hypothetical protein n=1 Tax=Neptunomonas phycophila TaxID=1572645 RepID=UPI003B8C57FE